MGKRMQEKVTDFRLFYGLFLNVFYINGNDFKITATNKKEARKQAAKAACQDLYNIVYMEGN